MAYPAPTHDVVIYEHRLQAVDIPDADIPRMSNKLGSEKMLEVLAFLSSASTVITNTYHGTYWSMLLGRPVVVYKPFSNRFYGFKPGVLHADETNWKHQVSRATSVPKDYLAECRSLNVKFSKQVALLYS